MKTALVALMLGAASSSACGWVLAEWVGCATLREIPWAGILTPRFVNIHSHCHPDWGPTEGEQVGIRAGDAGPLGARGFIESYPDRIGEGRMGDTRRERERKTGKRRRKRGPLGRRG